MKKYVSVFLCFLLLFGIAGSAMAAVPLTTSATGATNDFTGATLLSVASTTTILDNVFAGVPSGPLILELEAGSYTFTNSHLFNRSDLWVRSETGIPADVTITRNLTNTNECILGFTTGVDNVKISGLTLSSSGQQAYRGIWLDSAYPTMNTNFTFEDLAISSGRSYSYAISMYSASDITIKNVACDNYFFGAYVGSSDNVKVSGVTGTSGYSTPVVNIALDYSDLSAPFPSNISLENANFMVCNQELSKGRTEYYPASNYNDAVTGGAAFTLPDNNLRAIVDLKANAVIAGTGTNLTTIANAEKFLTGADSEKPGVTISSRESLGIKTIMLDETTGGAVIETGLTIIGYTGTYPNSGLTPSTAYAAFPAGGFTGASVTVGNYDFSDPVTGFKDFAALKAKYPTITGEAPAFPNKYQAPTISFTPPNGTVGAAYSATPTFTCGNGTPAFAVTSGALPGGLTLNATTGAITGTPTAQGTFNFTITVKDSQGQTAFAAASITIAAAAQQGGNAPVGGSSSNSNWNADRLLSLNGYNPGGSVPYSAPTTPAPATVEEVPYGPPIINGVALTGTGYVMGNKRQLYATPSTKGKKLGQYANNTPFEFYGISGNFAYVGIRNANGETEFGYILLDYTHIEFKTTQGGQVLSKAGLFSRASTSSKYRLKYLPKGDSFEMLGRHGKYWIVSDTSEGYMEAKRGKLVPAALTE